MVVLIGAGGHGKVVLDTLLVAGIPISSITLRDANPGRTGQFLLGVQIQGPGSASELTGRPVHVSIGDAASRARLLEAVAASGADPHTIIHPASSVAASAVLRPGVFVAAGAIVGPDAQLGAGAIVNHNAVVDHDCAVGAYAHIAPGATLGGGVRVGEAAMIGAGAVILPGLTIGAKAVIGAGAVVTRNVPSGETWLGVPARNPMGKQEIEQS